MGEVVVFFAPIPTSLFQVIDESCDSVRGLHWISEPVHVSAETAKQELQLLRMYRMFWTQNKGEKNSMQNLSLRW